MVFDVPSFPGVHFTQKEVSSIAISWKRFRNNQCGAKTTNQITILRPDFLVSEPKDKNFVRLVCSFPSTKIENKKKLISGSPSSFRNCQNYCYAISSLRDLLNKNFEIFCLRAKRQKFHLHEPTVSVDQNRKTKKLISGSPRSFRIYQNY